MSFFEKLFGSFSDKELKRINPLKDKVLALEPEMQKLTDEQLQAKTTEFKARLEKGETLDDLLPEAFAVCREADWRVLGMKPYPVQIIGGIVLHRACIAEMQTGEGKTLVATMPVYLNALTGKGVHVITVNDYLARRDSEWMGKVYRFLAVTYNKIYLENQETQKLIRHEAEHDALTDALNRGSFEKILSIYEKGQSDFAMIICDVDSFKTVNDTYGHAVGDEILKKVASLLQKAFRSIDYVCRIGGDEFAVIMVDMTTDLTNTIKEKINLVNDLLSNPADGLPPVSLSVGVAFSDRQDPGESIFKDADHALYHVKQHGKHGCGFYGAEQEPCAEPDAAVPMSETE